MARNPTVQEVTLAQVEEVAHRLARELMEWGEPIPAFETRFPDRLESCLRTPFQKYGGRSLYAGIVGKGAALFYLMYRFANEVAKSDPADKEAQMGFARFFIRKYMVRS